MPQHYHFLIPLQAAIRGCLLRSALIHDVRSEYEAIFDQIENANIINQSARCVINWPNEILVCYPIYSTQSDDCVSNFNNSNHHQYEQDFNEINNNHNHNNIGQLDDNKDNITSFNTSSKEMNFYPSNKYNANEHIPTIAYPPDVNQLMMLRDKLCLELLWIKQAMESRRQYLQLKCSLDKETNN